MGQGTFCSSSEGFCCALCADVPYPHPFLSEKAVGFDFIESRELDVAGTSCACQLEKDWVASLDTTFLGGSSLAASWQLHLLGGASFVCDESPSQWSSPLRLSVQCPQPQSCEL